ncbi:MAG: hypothetical protein EPN49_00170 [Rhodanobacter sp.]|nr:MAG: hypothetical protein EPN49_00170 [Rhodanobacter sp.]
MKSHKLLFATLAATGLLFAGNLIAQQTPATASSAAGPSAAGTASPPATAVFQTPQGEVTIRSVPAPAPTFGPAPSFKQLSAGGKAITAEQAAAYPPLANDFIHADSNKNGSISKAEYERWVKQL